MPFKHFFGSCQAALSLSLSLSPPSLPLPLSLSLPPVPFRSLPLSLIVRQLLGVARRTHKVAANWSSRNLGRWQGRPAPASLQRMRGRLGRQAGKHAGSRTSRGRKHKKIEVARENMQSEATPPTSQQKGRQPSRGSASQPATWTVSRSASRASLPRFSLSLSVSLSRTA